MKTKNFGKQITSLGCFFILCAATAWAGNLQVLSGHVPAAVKSLHPTGLYAATNRLDLAIGLPLRNAAALSNLLHDIYDPASPQYRHYLTPGQFTEQFGPTKSDYDAVIAFAKAKGLKVTATYPNRMLVDVNGSVADVERAMNVTLRTYNHPTEKRTFYAPDSEPSLDLAVPVLHISGLDNFTLPKPLFQKMDSSISKPAPATGSGPGGAYMGKDFRTAYVPGVSLTGAGQYVGLFQIESGFYQSDISTYETNADLPNVPVHPVLLDGYNGGPGYGNVEVSLDIEMVISMAPGVSGIYVFEGSSPDDILNAMAASNQIHQFSASWGYGVDSICEQIYQEMGLQGQTFLNASGDGDAWLDGVYYSCLDDPYITIVGGTTLTMNGTSASYASESAWNWGFADDYGWNPDGYAGTSGGISTSRTIPWWQTNVSMASNQGSTTMRNMPDVAMTADNIWVIFGGGSAESVGGTSCASPLWAGFTALVNQQAAASSQPLAGFINPAVYAIGKGVNYTSCFHDTTAGNNTWPESPTKFYAVPGYDLCTGWGSPVGQALINALANPEALVITPAAGFASSGGVGGPFTVTSETFVLTNVGTNTLSWSLANTSLWLNVSSTGSTLTAGGPATNVTVSLNTIASNLLAGSYSATISFTNLNDNVGQSRQFALNVIAPPTITMQPTNQAVLEGATAAFSVSATGGLPLYYQWQDNGTNLTDGGNIFGSATTNLVINDVSDADVGIYTVLVTNVAGSVTSSNALLTLQTSPPIIVVQPANQTVVAGTTAQFSVGVIGTTPYSYQWSFDGTNLVCGTNAMLVLPNVQTNQAGTYAVTVTNLYGSAQSSNATLAVVNVPVITSFSPTSGTNGTVVNINGFNFDPTPSNNIVRFGAVQAVVSAASTTNLVVTLPPGATYGPITETVNGLTAYSDTPFLPTFLGNGSPIGTNTLGPSLDLNTAAGSGVALIADLDGDGRPDLIIDSSGANILSIYQNISSNGTLTAGSFGPRLDLPLPGGAWQSPDAIAVADVDGDGKLDIMVHCANSGVVSIYRNISTPGTLTTNSFAPRMDFAAGSSICSIAAQDLNGDGLPDIVVANGTTPGNITILQNESTPGNIAFGAPVTFATGNNPSCVAIGDLDGDGYPDIAVANYNADSVSIFRNLGLNGIITTNSFAPQVDIPTIASCYVVALGDMDGDGKLDLVVGGTTSGEIAVLRNTSIVGSITTNSFAAPVVFAVGAWADDLALGDINGDGKLDIALACQEPTELAIFQNTSTPGSFTTNSLAAAVAYPASGSVAMTVSVNDLDGDGRPDIMIPYVDNSIVSVYQNSAPFGGPPVITAQPNNATVFEGQTATFTVVATGTPPLSYQWAWGSTNIPGATNSTLILTDVQYNQAGTYAVTVTNLYGSTNSISATLTVNTPPPCDPAPSGLVALWRAEGNAYDSAGTNNGTLYGGASYAPGVVGQAFLLDGSSGYVFVPTSPSLNVGLSNGLTIEGWINPLNMPAQEIVAEWNNGSGNYGWGVHIQISTGSGGGISVGALFASVTDTSGTEHILYTSPGVLVTNQFQHIALTYDKSSGLGTLYVNGLVATQQNLGIFTPQTSYYFYLGARPNTSLYFSGLLDELSVYGRALSTNEIQAIYNAGSGGKCPLPPVILVQPVNQIVTVGANTTFNVVAGGEQPLAYQWNFGETNIVGATNTTLTLTNVQLTQAGVYAVTVTNLYGSATSSNATLTVGLAPSITTQPAGQTNYAGSNVTFTVVATGSLPLSYQWNFNGTNILGATNTSLILTDIQLTQSGSYAVLVTNAFGSVLSSNAVLTVVSGPTITTQPTNQTVVVGQTAIFSVAVTGTAPLAYQWSFGVTNLPNATNSSLVLSNVQTNQAGIYAVIVTNFYGTAVSSNAVLTVTNPVNNVPVIISFSPILGATGTVVNITGLNFSATTSNNIVRFGAVQAMVSVASTTNLVVTVPRGATFAPITETVNGLTAYSDKPFLPTFPSNGQINTSSLAASLTLNTTGDSTTMLFADLDGDGKPDVIVGSVNPNTLSIFQNISTNGSISAGSFGPRIDLSLPCPPQDTTVADVDGDGKLDILVLNANSDEVSIFRNISTPGTLTTNSFAAPVTVPTGSTGIAFAAQDLNGDGKPDMVVAYGTTPGTISIFQNESTPGNIVFAAPVTYTTGNNPSKVVIGDLDGDGYPDIAVANYSGSSVSILRNLGTGGNITSNSFATHVDIPTIASCYVLALGDMDGDGKLDLVVGGTTSGEIAVLRNTSTPGSITINSFAAPVTFASGAWVDALALGDINGDGKLDIALACQESTKLSIFQNTSTPGSFTSSSLAARVDYSAYSSSSDGYSVFIGDLNGDGRPDIAMSYNYSSVLSVYQNVLPFGVPPTITTQPTNKTVMAGGTASFSTSVSTNSTLPLSYQWNFGGTNIVGATNTVLTLTNVQLTQAGVYAVTVTNLYGSVTSSNATLTVGLAPSITTQPVSETNLVGTSATFTVVASGSTPLSYQWNFNGTNIVGGTNTLLTLNNIQTTQAGNYAVQVSNAFGSITSSNATLTVMTAPTITTQPTNETLTVGQMATFSVGANGTPPLSYQWTFNGTCLPGANSAVLTLINAQIAQSGIYVAVVTNMYGSAVSSNATLTVYSTPTITTQPFSQTNYVSTCATFMVIATGSTPLNYVWYFNGTNLYAPNSPALTLSNLQFSEAGNYAVLVTNTFGSVLSSNAALVVNQLYHYVWNTIPSPRFATAPFAVTVQAENPTNGLATNFNATVMLLTTNGMPVSPSVSGNFVQGVWTGAVTLAQTGTNLVLEASDTYGEFGLANPINVVGLPPVALMPYGNTMYVYWPANPSGFVLEESPDLSAGSWVPVTTPPIVLGDLSFVPIPMAGTNAFYRLHYTGE